MKKAWALLFSILIIIGCHQIDVPYVKQLNNINFKCSVIYPDVKSSQYFGYGKYATIYAFDTGDLRNYVGNTPVSAFSSGYGQLVTLYPLSISDGIYDFYSISENSGNSPQLYFYDGQASGVVNGIDYLWAASKEKNITYDRNVEFHFKHVSCQIKLTILSEGNVSSVNVTDVKFTFPSQDGASIYLSEGYIAPVNNVGALESINGYAHSMNFYLLPCTASMIIEVVLDASIDGDFQTGRIYRATLSEDFIGGNAYELCLTVKNNNTISVNCKTKAWSTHTESITY
ncbi:MAG TPA: fimbrillin family protein [Bacteroidales bacterium]|nr:fimbrillin family protein [Bacteroidales bacterium]HRR48363.1 fimbrillin family protein [Bacteroidales bacterium]HRT33073.1 fimbrillin family protein [Bacteroidales bacterium]HRT83208.1 fimbrillin family protein [Bacteroidales bacterium]